ncbi:MAG: endonuclease/exonuclease/phosphatase family protein, partial [Cyanobacteria bacterium REEB65]|nr:endonuclease/exonuclease/phosphatase family protein [Cyanobacteria bacterium REEB65]
MHWPVLEKSSVPGSARLVTFNLAGLQFEWFERRLPALLKGLRALAPDVVCFQEAAVRKGPTAYNQAEAVGLAVGLPFVSFAPYGNPVEAASEEIGGIAVVSRWPIGFSESWRLPPGGQDASDNRVALLVKLLATWGGLFVATTHLSWKPEEAAIRLRQAEVLLDRLGGLGLCQVDSPLVVIGDLNAPEGEVALERLGRDLRDCFRMRNPSDPGFTWSR